jgi:hypothetical protein
MKAANLLHPPSCSICLVSLACLALPAWLDAADLSVTPSSASSTFSGSVDVTISGLTNGETVLLEKFQDRDGNGLADPSDPLVASYTLTDGQVTSIAGVRNRNIPGDDDGSANGQIALAFTFRALVEFERSIGPYVYRVSSPGGRFAPVTSPFVITPASYPQSVSGIITNASGSRVPYAGVGVLDVNGEFVTGGGANAAGAYFFALPPGSYQLIAVHPGYVVDMSQAPQVNLAAGQSLSADLVLKAGSRTLSGRIRDAQTGIGLAGMQVFFQSGSGAIAIAFTDAAGDFNVSVPPGLWTVEPSELALALRGYPYLRSPKTNDLTAGDVSGTMIDVTRGTSLVYGTVTDDHAQKVAGLSAYCANQQNPIEGSGVTDANGNYCVAAGPGDWWFGFSDDDLSRLGLLVQGTNFTLSAGQALRVDFTAWHATSHLRGVVRDSLGAPLSDILLVASANNSHTSARSGADGSFDLPMFGGNWQVGIEGSEATARGLLSPSLQVTVTDGVDINGITVIALPISAQISGRVTNHLGQAEANLDLYVFTAVNGTNYNANARTDASGYYAAGVANGTWHVGIPCEQATPRGYVCPPEQLVVVSGVNRVANFSLAPPAPPSFSQPTIVEGQFRCAVNADPGALCHVRFTTDFITWSDLGTFTGPSFEFTDNLSPSVRQRFYRIEVVP